MPQSWSSQDADDRDDIDAWMARRNAQGALQPEADAAGRDLWNRAIQTGDELYAGNPSDLTAIGLTALSGAARRLTSAANDDRQYNGGDGSQGALKPSTDPTAPQDADGSWASELDVVGRPPDRTAHLGFFDGLNHSLPARIVGGVAGYAVGLPFGFGRAGWHAAEGVGDSLKFAASLSSLLPRSLKGSTLPAPLLRPARRISRR